MLTAIKHIVNTCNPTYSKHLEGYYPYRYDYETASQGMMENPKTCTKGYRFGFNGKEKDDNTYGDGNAYDFGARIYDSRLGRWLSLDPLQQKYPSLSPYNYVSNSPICLIDPDGRDNIIYLVVLPDALNTFSLQDISDIVKKANENFVALGVKTQVVAMVQQGPLPPAFNPKCMDETDAVAVLGGSAESTATFIKEQIDASFGADLQKKGGWVDRTSTPNTTNPENSEVGPGSKENPANVIAISATEVVDMAKKCMVTPVEMGGFVINHGAGHNADGTVKNVGHSSGVMTDGQKLDELIGPNGPKLQDFLKPSLNVGYKQNLSGGEDWLGRPVQGRFGNNTPKANYEFKQQLLKNPINTTGKK